MRCFTEKLLLPDSRQDAEYTAYLLDADNLKPDRVRPAVIVCPGGGYEHLAQREGEPIAMQYLSMGYHAFVLRYSVAPARFPTALQELALLVSRIRQYAAEWHVKPDQIVVSGFSAGGHLACSLGAFWNRAFVYEPLGLTPELIRPNAMILGYPVISAGPCCHPGSFRQLLGERAEEESMRQLVSLELQVGAHTPKTFLWHMMTDQSVPVQNSFLLAQALAEHHVSLELHIYPVGNHGLALGTQETSGGQAKYVEPQCQSWISLAKCWLEHTLE
ncbi:MAG: alpha/beta hydrolase [Lachnospiraceae bacterium]|nr:alpha/beta hydrolase [Lachnospiraceae bacterium]